MARNKEEAVEAVRETFSDSKVVEYEEVQGPVAPAGGVPLKFEMIGDGITGQYVRRRTVPANRDFREQTAYDILSESSGILYSVFGNSDLNAKMERVRVGSNVIIEFIGEEPIEGKPEYSPRKLFSVKVAKGGQTASAAANRAARKF